MIIFSLTLTNEGAPDHSNRFIRLPPPNLEDAYVMRIIVPAGSDALLNGRLLTNYPFDRKPFGRTRFLELPFKYDYITDGFCEFVVERAGAYEYYVEFHEHGETPKRSEGGYFIVDPCLKLNSRFDISDLSKVSLDNEKEAEDNTATGNMHILNMDSISLLTVVPKWLGMISEWKPHFKAISESGYNMAHFVPLQQRGCSNSPYSIFNQLALADDLFQPDLKLTDEEKYALLKSELERIEVEEGILSATDIVWNHTACNSEWLYAHPEAGYNIKNSPHLKAGYELDESIMQFSANLGRYGLAATLNGEADLKALLDVFRREVFDKAAYWQFYVLDVEREITRMRSFIASQEKLLVGVGKRGAVPDDAEQLASFKKECLDTLSNAYGRYYKTIHLETTYALLCTFTASPDSIPELLKQLLDRVNLPFYKEFEEDTKVIFDNMANRVRYERLAEHGPRSGEINQGSPMVSTYFTRIPRNSSNKHLLSEELIVANNGWIWNADPLIDFAGPGSKSYFLREIIPWGDCVKLRYGHSKEDNPWLWDHMEQYTLLQAGLFRGFRIDNCHSTPIHVAQYFLDSARQTRPNLYVFAELFTGSEERDITFVSKLGINSLIREAMNAWDAAELGRLVHRYGGQTVGSMALRADYLPLELVGHTAVDVSSPITNAFCCVKNDYPESRTPVPMDGDLSFVMPDPDESGRRSPGPLRQSTEDRQRIQSVAVEKVQSLNHISKHHYFWHQHNPSSQAPAPLVSELAAAENRQHDTEVVFRLKGSSPHALFMDCTHDNETPSQKRTPEDTLANAALVAMATCAVGSVKGYDEMVPTHLNIVHEPRKYQVSDSLTGIIPAKSVMLRLHYLMGQKGYSEIHVNLDNDFVTVYRQHPFTHHGYVLIANTGFTKHQAGNVKPVILRNAIFRTLLAARTTTGSLEDFVPNKEFINGLPCSLELSYEEPLPDMIQMTFGSDDLGLFTAIQPLNFPSGSILLIETDLEGHACIKLDEFRHVMDLSMHGAWYLDGIVRSDLPELSRALEPLNFIDLNIVLFKSSDEERDYLPGGDVYTIPGYGPLSYAGLQGWASVLKDIAPNNDLGHALCENLRQGTWALDYIVDRLGRYVETRPQLLDLHHWFRDQFEMVKHFPDYLRPKYFNIVVATALRAAQNRCLKYMSDFVRGSSRFSRSLALTTVQFYGLTPSAGLAPVEKIPGLAAGLPHFSTHHMRCWGRDVFISLPGLCLVTGLFDVAKDHILRFGACMRHGLIPNLLDCARRPRYNSRDAVWFFLQAVQEYYHRAPDGKSILEERIKMRFPSDEFVEHDDPRAYSTSRTVKELIFDIMQRHARGIHFREWNAGTALDHAMQSDGFNIDIYMDQQTGFVHGGNPSNCGTWMDKMGESTKAGTYGVPATPRDGAAVEITGLLKSCLRWLSALHKQGLFEAGVELPDGKLWTFAVWNDKIQASFEKHFYIPAVAEAGKFLVDEKLVNRRGIYKDTYGSTSKFGDYQLRPNFPIAMVVAPELFDPNHANLALKVAKEVLLAPLGMKTLDPEDWAYRGDYDNGNDGTDGSIARGFNYHQGPEWLWVLGYFLRAYYHFGKGSNTIDLLLIHSMHKMLRGHRKALMSDNPYAGLPELTNSNGKPCFDACMTQAWSSAALLDLIGDIRAALLTIKP